MAFAPIGPDDIRDALPVLTDVLPTPRSITAQVMYGWQFDRASAAEQVIEPRVGDVALEALQPLAFSSQGLRLDGRQWLSSSLEQAILPEMPETISLEAWVTVESSPPWCGLVGATQDNNTYERGCLLGIHEDRFFFSLVADQKSRLTYLLAPAPIEKGKPYHVVGTFDGQTMRLYLDGAQVAESHEQSGALLIDAHSWLAVGAYKDNDELYPLTGFIRAANIYEGALTPEVIREKHRQ
jgi:hypothetical protein